jgi:hypothetical protein
MVQNDEHVYMMFKGPKYEPIEHMEVYYKQKLNLTNIAQG